MFVFSVRLCSNRRKNSGVILIQIDHYFISTFRILFKLTFFSNIFKNMINFNLES